MIDRKRNPSAAVTAIFQTQTRGVGLQICIYKRLKLLGNLYLGWLHHKSQFDNI